MKRLIAALALLSVTAAPLRADDPPPPPWQGLWQGTIGALPVRVCLSRDGEWTHAAYYYAAKMQTIRLDLDEDGSWSEHGSGGEKETGRWALAPTPDGKLKGDWTSGQKSLAIDLTRAGTMADQAEPCASRAFLAPRIRAVKRVNKPKKLGIFAWSEVTYDAGPGFKDVNLTSFSYPAVRPGDAAINAALRLDPDKVEGEVDYVGCFQGSIGSLGSDGELGFTIAPRFSTPGFLTVAVSSGSFCGGAHPNFAYWWRVYDRASGKPVDLAAWFKPTAMPPQERYPGSDELQVAAPLIKLAMRQMKGMAAECADAVRTSDYWYLGLDRAGLIMTPSLPHVVMACSDDAVVPYAALEPYLTPVGKAGVARLVAGRP